MKYIDPYDDFYEMTSTRHYDPKWMIMFKEGLKEKNLQKLKDSLPIVFDNLSNKEKFEVLKVSSEKGFLDIIKILKEYGYDIHIEDEYALRIAASNGHLELVKYLFEQEVNINIYDDNTFFENALIEAARNHHDEIVKYLVEQGVDPNAGNGKLVDLYATKRCIYNNGNELNMLEFLLSNGAYPDLNNNEALKRAAEYGYLDAMKCLYKYGADIHVDDDELLVFAAMDGYFDIVKFLVENDANIHADEEHALRYAAYNGYYDIVEYLLQKGADASKVELKSVDSENIKELIIEYL